MEDTRYLLRPIGVVRSPLKSLKDCPKQGNEGAPDAWLEIDAAFADALEGLTIGREILLLTWLHQGQRDLLRVHPRGNPNEPLKGVFVTRSPDRPNPVGLHRVKVVEFQKPTRIRVRPLEVVDGTPLIDIKPVMRESGES
jgi:tRNA-Thr(GGU) m(6)t(6)A37 methyltransferase TsaA